MVSPNVEGNDFISDNSLNILTVARKEKGVITGN